MTSYLLRTTASALLATVLAACISPGPPPLLRYFRPLLPEAELRSVAEGRPLQLARVTAAAHLEQRMVWRVSDVEVAFDEVHRWVAPPAELTEDACERALFGEAGFRPAEHDAPQLELHLLAFERDRTHALVVLGATLRPRDGPPALTVVRAHHPVGGDGPEAYARALGRALAEASRGVAVFVREAPGMAR